MSTENIYIEVSQRRHEKKLKIKEKLTGSASALLMIAAAIVALILVNIGFSEQLHEINEIHLGFQIAGMSFGLTVEEFVNDFLMALFFLMVGCELKYEMTVGALCDPKQAILPIVAACGGVMGPALIFLALNFGGEGASGWAVPTATDIAFALAVMSIFGDRMPVGAKVFFSTLAIADDLVAIIIIAVAYSTELSLFWLGGVAVVTVLLIILNRSEVYSLFPYVVLGLLLWVCFLNSGIHATLAGVVLAFTLPVKSDINLKQYAKMIGRASNKFQESYDPQIRILGQHHVTEITHDVQVVSNRVTPPLQRIEHSLSTFVNFIVLPLFAFCNAQVYIAGADLATVISSPVTLGVWFGLLLGKPIGILLTTMLLTKFFGFDLPKNTTWGHLIGVGILAGIGFTMAILVSSLAFTDADLMMNAKVGILLGTFSAAIIGLVYLFIYLAIAEKRTKAKASAVGVEANDGLEVKVDAPGTDNDAEFEVCSAVQLEQVEEQVSRAVSLAVQDAIVEALKTGKTPAKVTVSLESEDGETQLIDLRDIVKR